MLHKQSVLSFFPDSTLTPQSGGEGFLATVASQDGMILMSEYGKTEKEAWRNVYIRIYKIWQPIAGAGKAAQLLTTASQPEPN